MTTHVYVKGVRPDSSDHENHVGHFFFAGVFCRKCDVRGVLADGPVCPRCLTRDHDHFFRARGFTWHWDPMRLLQVAEATPGFEFEADGDRFTAVRLLSEVRRCKVQDYAHVFDPGAH